MSKPLSGHRTLTASHERTLDELLSSHARSNGMEPKSTNTPVPPELEELDPNDPLLKEMELLAAENQQVLSSLSTGYQQGGSDLDIEDDLLKIQKEYEELLEEKSESIRQLYRENQELKQQLEQVQSNPTFTDDDLQAYAEELKRDFQEVEHVRQQQDQERKELESDRAQLEGEYRQMQEDKEAMERDLGRMEAEFSQERVAIQRQRIELQRLFSDVKREFERLRNDKSGDLQEKLKKLKQLSDMEPDETAQQARKSPAGSGFFSRFIGRGKDGK